MVVNYTVSGSATNGVDYTTLPGTLTIPAGSSSAPLVISPINDTLAEGTEDVTITLSSNAAYNRNSSALPTAVTVVLMDDDIATITVTASKPTASEVTGDEGIFLITRTGSTAQPLTLNYALGGSAHQGVDYVPLPGVLTIPAGSSVGTVTITPISDGLGEPQQTVSLQLRGGAGFVSGAPSIATINLVDNRRSPGGHGRGERRRGKRTWHRHWEVSLHDHRHGEWKYYSALHRDWDGDGWS